MPFCLTSLNYYWMDCPFLKTAGPRIEGVDMFDQSKQPRRVGGCKAARLRDGSQSGLRGNTGSVAGCPF